MSPADAPPLVRRTDLADLLRSTIAQEGPITVERFMALALGHPTFGYYMTRDPFGAAGDFTTAPEISQMFGELLGLWAAAVWQSLGQPQRVHLVELGPGRGTLMSDALRALRGLPALREALDVHLVETSPVLRQMQETTLRPTRMTTTWHTSVDTLPDGPLLVLANEFFDALPIRQFVRTGRGWCERLVGLGPDDALAFGLAAEPIDHSFADHVQRANGTAAPLGATVELCPAGFAVVESLAARICRQGGALLAIDYGHGRSGFADTLQAVKNHQFVDPLAEPGAADLTAHVDFAALGRAARRGGATVQGSVTQGVFLRGLGLDHRSAVLKGRATPAQSADIEAAVARLAGPSPGMGELFKVMAVTAPGLPTLPGFETEPPQ